MIFVSSRNIASYIKTKKESITHQVLRSDRVIHPSYAAQKTSITFYCMFYNSVLIWFKIDLINVRSHIAQKKDDIINENNVYHLNLKNYWINAWRM